MKGVRWLIELRLLVKTDPLGRKTGFSYDALSRLTSIADPLAGTTSFTYDPNGNLLTVTDARGNITRHEYDALDRLSRRIDPLNRAETFGYDGNGNLVSTTDRKNQTTTFTYDALNRRTQASYADGSVVTYADDAGGRLTQVDDTADSHRPITRTYDLLDRLLTETTALSTVTYTYNAVGRRTSMIVSGQAPVTYTYDANSRLRAIAQAPLNPVALDYNPANRRTSLVLPNGVSTEYQYDAASQLTALIYRNAQGTTLGDLQYTYDANGNRLVTGGNWARTSLPAAVSSTTYDQANEQLAFGSLTQAFDSNGNLLTQTTTGGTTTYTWDARDRLVGLSGPTVSATFTYDGLGRRATKTMNGQSTSFLYEGRDVVWENGPSGEATYLRSLSIDEALSRTDPTGTTHYLTDALGSSVALADAAGNLPTTYTFAPFGDTAIAGTPSANPFGFTGRENDGIGLYYYRARYYDPVRSRFIASDPIRFLGGDTTLYGHVESVGKALVIGTNLYAYARNNPINRIDPSGLLDCPCDQRAELDWSCFLMGNAISVIWNAPLAVGIGVGIASSNPAGVGLAIASATLLAANEGILYNMCLRCVPR